MSSTASPFLATTPPATRVRSSWRFTLAAAESPTTAAGSCSRSCFLPWATSALLSSHPTARLNLHHGPIRWRTAPCWRSSRRFVRSTNRLAPDPGRRVQHGRSGTWFMSSRHPDLFTGAIAMAASTGDLPQDGLAKIPTYVIHSRDDQVVPFGPAERNAKQLEELGRPITFEELHGPGHFDMGSYIEPLQRAGRWIATRWAR